MSTDRPFVPPSAAAHTADLFLTHLQGLHRDLSAILEHQRRDRELVGRFGVELGELRLRVDQGFVDIRRDVQNLKGDVILVESGLLTRHNEIFEIMHRLDGQAPGETGVGPSNQVPQS